MTHDADSYLHQWFTKKGAEKLSRYDNPKVEELLPKTRVADRAAAQKAYEEVQKILWEEEPTIWPMYSVATYAMQDRLVNYEARSDYGMTALGVSLK